MEWIRAHLLPHHEPRIPQELSEASHRLANESMALRGEIVRAAGGQHHFDRRAAELRETMDHMLRQIQ